MPPFWMKVKEAAAKHGEALRKRIPINERASSIDARVRAAGKAKEAVNASNAARAGQIAADSVKAQERMKAPFWMAKAQGKETYSKKRRRSLRK